jgi:hypothetical protein
MPAMTSAEIANLLALDRRAGRVEHLAFVHFPVSPADWKRQKRDLWTGYVRARVELAQINSALRRYIEIREKPEEMKWCHATLRELDEIRALAGLTKRVYEKTKDSNCGQQRSAG